MAGIVLGGAEPTGSSDFWAELAQPGFSQYAKKLAAGKQLFDAAQKITAPPLRDESLKQALAAFKRALQHYPNAAEGHRWVAKTLFELEQMQPAITAVKTARRLDPQLNKDYSIAFEMGIAYSKIGDFELAVAEYDRSLAAVAQSKATARHKQLQATLHGNAAESLMALGRLDDAIRRYQDALAINSYYRLGWWGLAVALDRDEQIAKSQAAAAQALAYDPSMRSLRGDSVFFVPPGDVHYYHALGHLARGRIEKARAAFQTFLSQCTDSPWAFRAKQHLTQMGSKQNTSGKSKRKKRLAPFYKDKARVTIAGIRDRASVRYRIQSRYGALRRCYQQARKKMPSLHGEMKFSLVINGKGKLQSARVLSNATRRSGLAACVVTVLKRAYYSPPRIG